MKASTIKKTNRYYITFLFVFVGSMAAFVAGQIVDQAWIEYAGMMLGACCFIATLQKLRAMELELDSNHYSLPSTEQDISLTIRTASNLRAIFSNTSDLFVLLDRNFNVVIFNENHATLVKAFTGKILVEGASFFDYVPSDRISSLQSKFELVLEGQSVRYEARYRRDDKDVWFDVSITPVWELGDKVTGICITSTDSTSMKKAALGAMQQRLLLEKALETAKLASWVADLSITPLQLQLSREALSMHGITAEEFDGTLQTFLSLVHDEDRDRLTRAFERVIDGGSVLHSDHRILLNDGTTKWFFMRGHIIQDEKAGLHQIVGVFQDITERKLVEQILSEYNERFEILSRATNDAIWDWDIRTDVVEWNHGIETLFGYRTGEFDIYSKWMLEKIHPKDAPAVENFIQRAFEARSSRWTATYRFRHADGRYRYVEDRAFILYHNEQPVRMIGAKQDITERKEYESQITHIAKELSSLIANANVPIVAIDANGLINEWNDAASSLAGYEKSEVAGRKWLEFLDKGDRPSAKAMIRKVIIDGVSIGNFEVDLLSRDGQRKRLLTSASPRRDDDGNISGVIMVGQNITELSDYRLNLERIIDERTRELNEALRNEKSVVEMKSKFVAIASHEFRTPLSTISILAGALKKYGNRLSEEEKGERLDGILQQVSQMTYLLEDILTIGKADAGKIPVIPSVVEVDNFITSIVSTVEQVMGSTHVIIVNKSLLAQQFATDEKLLRNIVINLLTNAIKFSPGAEEVVLAIETDSDMMIIDVVDFGIGIPSNEIKNLFEPFYRATNASEVQGTGLGLSIIKKAIELLNGNIKIDSKLGHGTRINVVIPTCDA